MLGFFMRMYKLMAINVRIFLQALELTNIVTIPPKGETFTYTLGTPLVSQCFLNVWLDI